VGIAQDEHPGAGGRGPAGGDDDASLAITKSDCPAVTKLAVRLQNAESGARFTPEGLIKNLLITS